MEAVLRRGSASLLFFHQPATIRSKPSVRPKRASRFTRIASSMAGGVIDLHGAECVDAFATQRG